jgi:hypothetical protein
VKHSGTPHEILPYSRPSTRIVKNHFRKPPGLAPFLYDPGTSSTRLPRLRQIPPGSPLTYNPTPYPSTPEAKFVLPANPPNSLADHHFRASLEFIPNDGAVE